MGGPKSMQDIGPDMDDLLRRAAENYPLRETPDYWDDIAAKLNETPAGAKSPRKRWLLLLLLLPVSLASYLMIGPSYFTTNHTTTNITPISDTKSNPGRLRSDQPDQVDDKTPAQKADKKVTGMSAGQADGIEEVPGSVGAAVPMQALQNDQIQNIPAANGLPHKQHVNSYDKKTFNTSHQPGSSYTDENSQQNELMPLSSYKNILELNTSDAKYFNASFNAGSLKLLQKNQTATGITALKNRNRGFYIGAMTGIGFSSVKNYGLQKAGYDFGLIAGYRLNKRWSLETGVIAVQKYYMSRGDDFSMDNLSSMMQPGMYMMEVEGSSRVLDIPLYLRYNVFNSNNQRVFARAGISSLIMTSESNRYHAMDNGSEQILKGIYKENKNYVAATVNFAAGYERRLRGNFDLRIEPYVQVPLRNVGIGNLPVASVGLHLGVTWPAQ